MTPAGWGLYQWRVEALSVSLYAQRHFCRFHSFTCCRSKSELEEDVVVGECINWKEGGPGWQQMKPAIYRNGGLQWRCVSRSSCLLFKSDFLDSGALFYLRLASAVNLLPTSTQTVSIWAGWKVWALEKKRQNDVIEAVEDKLAMNDSHAFFIWSDSTFLTFDFISWSTHKNRSKDYFYTADGDELTNTKYLDYVKADLLDMKKTCVTASDWQ